MRLLWLLLSSALLTVSLRAQTFVPHSIVFEGAPGYEQKELLAASGLQVNKPVTQADLDAVTQLLGDTGVFSDITFTTSGTTLTFSVQPAPASEMRKAVFTNFVLYPEGELASRLRTAVPLFHGAVPVTGGLQQSIAKALEVLLKERGIDASVTTIGSTGAIDYAIDKPPVVVSALAVQGANFEGEPSLAKIRDSVIGAAYLEGLAGPSLKTSVKTALIDAYLNLGYVDVTLTDLSHGEPQISPEKIGVPLTGVATPGVLYHIARLTLPNPVQGVTGAEVAAAATLKVGSPASRIELLSTKVRLAAVFSSRGYLDVQTTYTATKDEPTHSMSYVFEAVPGEVYHLRSLQTNNMSAQQAQKALAGWKIPQGAVFNRLAMAEYLKQGTGAGICGGRAATGTVVPDRVAHTVDVLLGCEAQ